MEIISSRALYNHGKTTLKRYMRYGNAANDYFYEEDYIISKLQDGIIYRVKFVDTQDTDVRLRELIYKSYLPFIFILCYSVNSRPSFEAISQKWIPEILKYYPNSPYILCGTKIDLRNTKTSTDFERAHNFIWLNEAKTLAKHVSAVSVIECSAYHDCIEHGNVILLI